MITVEVKVVIALLLKRLEIKNAVKVKYEKEGRYLERYRFSTYIFWALLKLKKHNPLVCCHIFLLKKIF
jgi:hypothetical protein